LIGQTSSGQFASRVRARCERMVLRTRTRQLPKRRSTRTPIG
jgi:hypothetical protein